MTLAEEKALLAQFAKTAGAGEMLNIHDLKAAYEKAIGHARIIAPECGQGLNDNGSMIGRAAPKFRSRALQRLERHVV
jgi:hypothetical protein